MEKKQRYDFGWTDHNFEQIWPETPFEYFYVSKWERFKMAFAYVMLALSLTMVAVPMAWVKLFQWALS